jgi:putative membrane protein
MALQHLLASAALIGLIAQPALAQNRDTTEQRPTQEVQDEIAQEDLDFATAAAQGGLKEVGLGELAEQQAATPAVQRFGERMVEDHSRSNEQLMQIMAGKGIELPQEMPKEAQELHDELQQKSGAAFDQAYMAEMLRDHEADIEDFQEYAETGQDRDLRGFAEQTLPILEQHRRLAQRTEEQVTAAAEQGTQPEAAQQPQPAAQAEQPVSVDRVLGSRVVNAQGQELGEIEDLVLDQNQIAYVVMSVGGFLGLGEKRVAVPLDDLQLGEGETYLMSAASQEQLEQMPAYDEGQFQPYAQR